MKWENMNGSKKAEYVCKIRISIYNAFKLLGKNKVYTKMNFEDCQSCGCIEMNERTKNTDYIGWIFYHNQDNDDLCNKGQLYLAYKGLTVPNVNLGKMIINVLKESGLITEWNGNDNNRILISGLEVK